MRRAATVVSPKRFARCAVCDGAACTRYCTALLAGKPRLVMKAAVDRGTMVGSRKLATHAARRPPRSRQEVEGYRIELSTELTVPTDVPRAGGAEDNVDSNAVVFVTCNAPGVGKSDFLDRVADAVTTKKIREGGIYEDVLTLVISMNDWMSAYTKSLQPRPHCLSIRWLLAYHAVTVDGPNLVHAELEALANALVRLEQLTKMTERQLESAVLAAIEYDFMQHHEVSSIDKLRTVLLCDEPSKTSNVAENRTAAELEMYNSVMAVVDEGVVSYHDIDKRGSRRAAVLTSLSTIEIRATFSPASGRSIEWISFGNVGLDLAHIDALCKMANGSFEQQAHYFLATGGHARLLVQVKKLLKDHNEAGGSLSLFRLVSELTHNSEVTMFVEFVVVLLMLWRLISCANTDRGSSRHSSTRAATREVTRAR